jgi:hypothetical protein
MCLLLPVQDNCLALLSSSRSSRAVQQAAAAVLLQLITGLKASIVLASHPELAHSEYGDGLAATAAATAAGIPETNLGPSAAQGGQGDAAAAGVSNDSSRSFLAAARLAPGGAAAAAALAAARVPVLDPSCPNCYPQLPMPDDSLYGSTAGAAYEAQWRLAGASLWDAQQHVDVTAAVNSICLQVRSLVWLQQRLGSSAALLLACACLSALPLGCLLACNIIFVQCATA